ncbi:thiamine-phosphate kinase [Calidifontibacillus oryziterrae]|uniref:thiamine-phosphate kinase n=1 Tax=Calidifontibacillus oryziterrae TaxID=1191699 RepID=UPI0003136A47|nr:thiamine-phosphate kinase [Calidifontibacillus oryziterrae]
MSIHDEFSFINSITPKESKHQHLITGIGDDAALYSGDSEVEEIIGMDTMVEGVHFTRNTMKPFHIGYKALASNISDIAAMGGEPTFYLVSLAIPTTWDEADLLEIYKGMRTIADRYNMDLIGGDTVSTQHSLVITITVLGRIKKGRRLLRQNAKPNDIVFVTGNIGDSSVGLKLLLEHGCDYNFTSDEAYLVKRHQLPEPRIEIGRILNKYSRVSLNDVSDGIASELNEIAIASSVTLEIDANRLPRSESFSIYNQEDKKHWLLYGGEDYELVGTVAPEVWYEVKAECIRNNYKITNIGYVKEGEPKVLLKEGNKTTVLQRQGYNHFRKNIL